MCLPHGWFQVSNKRRAHAVEFEWLIVIYASVENGRKYRQENESVSRARSLPEEFFVYTGAAATNGNSLYRCQKCPPELSSKAY